MRSGEAIKAPSAKAGMTMVEVMMAVAVFALLGAGIWMNVILANKSFQYNRISNANVNTASNVINRLAHGTPGFWGMRVASRSSATVEPTGVLGADGQAGWRATLRHNIYDTSELPAVMQDGEKIWTYDPIDREIDVDGAVVAEQVEDSYFRIQNGSIVLGVRVETEAGGSGAMMESLIRMRNP
jgi:prepilin-type N-terminal cleavage/methylation domain-containing protein